MATGDGAIPKEGEQGPEEVAERPSQAPTEAPRGCVVHKPERARAEQREQHGRRGASRHGAKRVLVPADYTENMFNLTCPRSYIKKLLENAKVVRFLNANHSEIFSEFESISAVEGI